MMLFENKLSPSTLSPHRQKIRANLFADEEILINSYLRTLSLSPQTQKKIALQAKNWVKEVQKSPNSQFSIQALLQAYPLSEKQGRALMSFAEAFLRIPDRFTEKLLIRDKITEQKGDQFRGKGIIKLSNRGLGWLAKIKSQDKGIYKLLNTVTDPITIHAFQLTMRMISREFILGQTIQKALKRSQKSSDRFSFDMLGESARTWSVAQKYKESYLSAIEHIAADNLISNQPSWERNSISVKLSALHPHYDVAHRDDVLKRMVDDLLELCVKAKELNVALTVDAEEANRLELSLDVIETVLRSSELYGWDGFGLAVQAYQKRALPTIEWLDSLSKSLDHYLMVRLVKGAYWDTEIKFAQIGGYENYSVFTRKAATDVSYLACAQKLLTAKGRLYPQFATHNAYTIAALSEMAKGRDDIEFQRLQGMGKDIYQAIQKTTPLACRVYAPVGNDKDLLAYLVRRLLENGANSSFIHKIYDQSKKLEDIIQDPFSFFKKHAPGPHPKIPLPKNLYRDQRLNSQGYDLDDLQTLEELKDNINDDLKAVKPESIFAGESKKVISPVNISETIGEIKEATIEDLEKALSLASNSACSWNATPVEKRAEILIKASHLLESNKGVLLGLLIKEAGKTLQDATSELREAVDFCRYYAEQAKLHFSPPKTLQGPTGELNQLSLHGRGVFACISPWNFPLAIFMGQVTAALVAGNAVIAKPSSQTPLVAYYAVKFLHQAGIPQEVLHYIPGPGSTIGTPLINDQRIQGVVFTGSTETAQQISQNLANRGGPIVPFIAETGGLNTMIVDSSALIEQVIDDVIASAFQSAGQRCSALRVLFVQEEIANETKKMLCEAIQELNVGDPALLSTDVGPVINAKARSEIEQYVTLHHSQVICRTPLSQAFEKGSFVAPTLIEVSSMKDVTREIFGPILHFCTFKAKELKQTINEINASGYGLTMGIESRIDLTINKVRKQAQVGNLYANRNIIGAVVGVQPFGGEGLSGSGPKAGGPYYLPRFAVEKTFSDNIMASGGNITLLNLEEE